MLAVYSPTMVFHLQYIPTRDVAAENKAEGTKSRVASDVAPAQDKLPRTKQPR